MHSRKAECRAGVEEGNKKEDYGDSNQWLIYAFSISIGYEINHTLFYPARDFYYQDLNSPILNSPIVNHGLKLS